VLTVSTANLNMASSAGNDITGCVISGLDWSRQPRQDRMIPHLNNGLR